MARTEKELKNLGEGEGDSLGASASVEKDLAVDETRLRAAARDLNEVVKPEPSIDTNAEVERLMEEVAEVAALLAEGDEITTETAEVLKDLGIGIPEGVGVKKELSEKRVDRQKVVAGVKGNKASKADKTAKRGISGASARWTSEGSAVGWRKGSSAQEIFLAVNDKGLTAEQILKKVKNKIKSSNPEALVKQILYRAVALGWIRREGDRKTGYKYFRAKP